MKRLVLVGLVFLGFSSEALAWGPNGGGSGAGEVHQDFRALRGDKQDLRQFAAIISNFQQARWRRDFNWMASLEQQFLGALNAEIRESRWERHAKARETNQNVDYHGWRDDARDVAAERASLRELRGLQARFLGLMGRTRRFALDEKERIMGRALQLARAELREDVREIREDRRDVREDFRQDFRQDRQELPGAYVQKDWRNTEHAY